ncbi:MAG TPA: hypothetical protein VIN04_03900 [Myxococcota bacterium]
MARRIAAAFAIVLALGLAAAPAGAADPPPAPEAAPQPGRRLEARWRRPPGCTPPGVLPSGPPGATGRRYEARSEARACRLSEEDRERVRLEGVWVEVPARAPRGPDRR